MSKIEKLIETLPDDLWFDGEYYHFCIAKKETIIDNKKYCVTYCTNENKHLYSVVNSSLKVALEEMIEKLKEEGWL